MRLRSRGLGRRELVLDFRDCLLEPDNGEVVIKGTIRDPVTWDFSIRLCEDDLPGLLKVALRRPTIRLVLRALFRRDRRAHWNGNGAARAAPPASGSAARDARSGGTGPGLEPVRRPAPSAPAPPRARPRPASSRYDAIVVGAGYGGVTASALLAKEGHRVLLVDKNDRPGGKAMTVHARGFGYELWPIAGGPASSSRFHRLVQILGLTDEVGLIVPSPAGELQYLHTDGTATMSPIWNGPGARSPPGVTAEDLDGMARLMVAIATASKDELARLDAVGALSWVRAFGVGRFYEAQLLATLNLLFVVGVDRLPASEAIRTLRDVSAGGAGRYHAGGYAAVAEAAVRYLEAHRGTFLPRTRVDRILVERGRAVGVATKAGEFRAPVVVSNAGIQPTVLKLAGPDVFPVPYVDRVRGLEPSWGFAGVRYFLDARVLTTPLVLRYGDGSWWDTERFALAEAGRWPDDPMLFVTVPSLYDPTLAPEGHQVVLAGTMCSPDPRSPMNDAAVARVEEAVARTWPEIEGHVVRREPFTPHGVAAVSRDPVVDGAGGECIGIAQVIGQCGASKPDVRTPLEGLWLVGCDAGGYGCGTHQAVDSGFVVAERLARHLARVT